MSSRKDSLAHCGLIIDWRGMMPSRVCDICKRLHQVSTQDWKFLDKSGDFACSRECIIEWIKANARIGLAPELVTAKRLDGPLCFRSDYEMHFSDWLTDQGYHVEYERWGFEVGETKTYTPDFFLPVEDVFIETKGKWGIGQHKKLKMFREQYPDVPLLVVPWVCKDDFYVKQTRWLR